MIDLLSDTFRVIPDSRHPDRTGYSLHDTLMSGFAMMFFQHPSLLEFQLICPEQHQRGVFGAISRKHIMS